MGSGQSEDQFWESSALLSELEARESRSPPGAFPSTAARGGSGGGGVGGAAVDTRAAAVRVGEEEEEEIEDHEEAFQAATRRRRSSKFTGTNPMLLFKGDRGVDQHHRRVHIDRHGSVDIRGSP
jgi:ribonucleotide monophosphatase NagD (HAD superfamily)